MNTHPCLFMDLADARQRDQQLEAERERRAAQGRLRTDGIWAVTMLDARRRLGHLRRLVTGRRSRLAAGVAPRSAKAPWTPAKLPVWAALLSR